MEEVCCVNLVQPTRNRWRTDEVAVVLLQALLLATLERLEGVEAVVAAADATSAAMEDKVQHPASSACCVRQGLRCV